jgi:hypothetical protein
MNPLQNKWESRLLEHRFCAEIVADFTTRMETNVSGLNDAKFQVKTLLPLRNICVTNDHGYVPLVVNTSQSFPHSRLITGFVTRLTRRVPLMEQELRTLL